MTARHLSVKSFFAAPSVNTFLYRALYAEGEEECEKGESVPVNLFQQKPKTAKGVKEAKQSPKKRAHLRERFSKTYANAGTSSQINRKVRVGLEDVESVSSSSLSAPSSLLTSSSS